MKCNRFLTVTCAGVMALVITGAVVAQNAPAGQPGKAGKQGQGRQGGRQRGVSASTVPVGVLDNIVNLTADQKTKIGDLQKKFTEETKDLRPKPGEQPNPDNMTKMREASKTANDQIEGLLTADQKSKWTEGKKELSNLAAAGIPLQVLDKLKITADQKKKMAVIVKEATEKVQALPQEERRTKGREIQKEARDKALEVLTAEQKAEIEKYNKEHPRPSRRPQP